MNEIATKLVRKSAIIIFWNLLLVFADEDTKGDIFTDWANSDKVKNLLEMAKILNLTLLSENKLEEFALKPSKTVEYRYLMQREPDKISIFVTPCGLDIHWVLYFRNETGDLFGEIGIPLQTYTGSDLHIYSSNLTDVGLYTLTVKALYEEGFFHVYISHDEEGPKLLQLADRDDTPRETKVKFDFKNNYTDVKWPKIPDEINYPYRPLSFVVSVSHTNFYKYLCLALVDNATTGGPPMPVERTEIDSMIYGKQYYVNVFVMDKSNFSVPYARINFVYQKPKPIGLRDGKVISENLMQNLGKISFKFKISKYVLPRSENILTWYVIPCTGKILVKIKHKKRVIREEMVQRWATIKIENPVRGDRYVMKITDASGNEFPRTEYVQVLATMRPSINPLSNIPGNLSVNESVGVDECYSEKISTVINWQPMAGNESTTYCIQVKELDYQPTNVRFSSQCALVSSNSTKLTQKCSERSSIRKPITQKLSNLKPDRYYIIHVTAKKYNRKVSIPYNLLRINKKDSCGLRTNLDYV